MDYIFHIYNKRLVIGLVKRAIYRKDFEAIDEKII